MENFTFAWLDRETYEGYPLKFSYRTDRHYRVTASQWSMSLREETFPEPVEKALPTNFLGIGWKPLWPWGPSLGKNLRGSLREAWRRGTMSFASAIC